MQQMGEKYVPTEAHSARHRTARRPVLGWRGRAAAAMTLLLLLGLAAAALPGTSFAANLIPTAHASAQAHAATTTPSPVAGLQDSVALSGLHSPTAVQFAADGRVFIAQKDGTILVYPSLTATTPTVFADLSREVNSYGDRGLLGLALDPHFPTQPYVYVLYTYDAPPGQTAPVWNDTCPNPTNGCVVTGRLSRLTADLSTNTMVPGSEQVMIKGWCQQFTSHSIADLQFGPDGMLYASAGDGASYSTDDYGQLGSPANPCNDPTGGAAVQQKPTAEGGALRSQSLLRVESNAADLNGALLRIDPATGKAPPTNPMASSSDPNAQLIVAEGMRNPFRFTFRPGSSASSPEVWLGDVGQNTWEEIDRVTSPTAAPVENFGWPCYEGPAPYGLYQNDNLNICSKLYSSGSAVQPYYTYNHGAAVGTCGPGSGSSAISGISFYAGNSYPTQFHNALFFEDYARNCIWAMLPGANGLPDPSKIETVVANAPTPVDLIAGPNGDLFYVSIYSNTLHRITAAAPQAVAQATSATSGIPPLTVSFSGTQSTDGDPNATLSYSWDLNGDGTFGDSTSPTPTFTYTQAGIYNVRLQVTDSRGLVSVSSPIAISVGTLTAPPAETGKVVLPETSIDAPALWAADTTSASTSGPATAIAWTGSDTAHHLNVETSVDGTTYTNKLTPNETSFVTPAVAVVNGDTVVLSWAGNDPGHSLNVLYDVYGTHGAPQKLTLHESSDFAPALAEYKGQLWLAWTGRDPNHSLNILPMGPQGLTPGTKATLSQYSATAAPSLVPDAGGTQLLLSWTASYPQGTLLLATSTDGVGWTQQPILGEVETSFAPPDVLAVGHGAQHLYPYYRGWTGNDPGHSLNIGYATSLTSWQKVTLRETAVNGPALGFVAPGTSLLMAWTGTDTAHHLNIATVQN